MTDPTAIIKRIIVTPKGDEMVEVYCPICPEVHTHGWEPGHRSKHCASRYRGDDLPGGYYIPYATTISMVDGTEVPKAAVDALAALDERWPGATLAQARPAIVAEVYAALRELYEITPLSDGEPVFDADHCFQGWTKRRCGEHRTVGEHRAWCHDCREWCYPQRELACDGCRITEGDE